MSEAIERIRAARRLRETRIEQKAAEVYATFDKNERTAVRFGMMPRAKVESAEADLIREFEQADGVKPNARDICRLLSVGIMDAANRGPDKLVV